MPFRPGAFSVFVLQPSDQGERRLDAISIPHTAGLQLQRAVVIEQLGHLTYARQLVATAYDRALAKPAYRVGGLRA